MILSFIDTIILLLGVRIAALNGPLTGNAHWRSRGCQLIFLKTKMGGTGKEPPIPGALGTCILKEW